MLWVGDSFDRTSGRAIQDEVEAGNSKDVLVGTILQDMLTLKALFRMCSFSFVNNSGNVNSLTSAK